MKLPKTFDADDLERFDEGILDAHGVYMMLINAIKHLEHRIEELEVED